ncbi:hypothetical protein LAZ67_14002030 [Cordylochernes scorpioides]|uniref:Reverse transcriptase Ty1/copia-type domain-containing protein n=1 Tax=Cordylochernes scorpioides TaxID=51811 RepID=A0ABY6L7F9_9ARAC|nr:hypothetical protein LAZ67_14002030 [Cordylochernes scorpioides]
MAKTMLKESGLDFRYWGEAILTANYLQNRLPARKLTKTPYELWNGIFVGYAQRSKAYRILFPETNKIAISRNVAFIENFDRNSVKDINEDFNIVNQNLFNKPQIKETNDHHVNEDVHEDDLQPSVDQPKEYLHRENDTWTLTDLPPGQKAIGCKWIFKAKYNQEGNVERFKERLGAEGFDQKYGEDYNKTFAPVTKLTKLRTMFSIAASKKLIIRHYDIKTAFLYGELIEEIYMDQPEEYIHIGKENLVCKLNKSIYGLKQSARSWYQKINEILRTLGLSQAKSDPCLYTNRHFGEIIYLLIYSKLSEHIQLKDLGDITHYLGIQIEKDIDGNILLHQKLKILRILDKYGMNSFKGISTPMESNEKYRKLIVELMYIANFTRPDISSAIGILSRRVVKPNEHDWKVLKRILEYLKSTLNLVLVFETSSSVELTAYTDADWGNEKDRKSTTGYIFKLETYLITWVSQKQNSVSLSSTEAEYVAAATAAQEAIWFDLLMSDFGFEIKKPIIINEVNQSCIKLLNSEKVTARTKHIDIKFHFIKDLISNNFLSLYYCSTEKMLADILTKPLPKNKFQELRQGIGLITHSH